MPATFFSRIFNTAVIIMLDKHSDSCNNCVMSESGSDDCSLSRLFSLIVYFSSYLLKFEQIVQVSGYRGKYFFNDYVSTSFPLLIMYYKHVILVRREVGKNCSWLLW